MHCGIPAAGTSVPVYQRVPRLHIRMAECLMCIFFGLGGIWLLAVAFLCWVHQPPQILRGGQVNDASGTKLVQLFNRLQEIGEGHCAL